MMERQKFSLLRPIKPLFLNVHNYRQVSSRRCKSFSFPAPAFRLYEYDTIAYRELMKAFPELSKFTVNSIIDYNDPDIHRKSTALLNYLRKVMSNLKLSIIHSLSLTEDLVSILMFAYQYIFHVLTESIIKGTLSHYKFLIKNLSMLNDYLILSLDISVTLKVLCFEFNKSLLKIVNKCLDNLYESLNASVNIELASHLLCCLHQTLAILVAFDVDRVGNEIFADEFIKISGLFEQSVRKSFSSCQFLQDIFRFQLGEIETWQTLNKPYIKASATFDKLKFYVILMKSENPRFSLRYLCLYYIWRIMQIIDEETLKSISKQMVELVLLALKDSSENINALITNGKDKLATCNRADYTMNVEMLLNEIVICFKIIQIIANNVCVLLNIFEFDKMKSLIVDFITAIFRFKLIPDENFSESLLLSYTNAHDYLAELFVFLNFLNTLNNVKGQVNEIQLREEFNTKFNKSSLTEITEETIKLCTKEFIKSKVNVIKYYIVELLFNCRTKLSRQMAECVVKLIEKMNFTTPKSLNISSNPVNPIEQLINERIIRTLINVIESDTVWAEITLKYFIEAMKNHCDKDETLIFGLCKLIYCSIEKKVFNDAMFQKELNESKEINYKLYDKYIQKGSSKTINGFNNIKGISELMAIASNDNHKLSKEAVKIIEKLLLKVTINPFVAKQVMRKPSLIAGFLKSSYDVDSVIITLLKNVLKVSKFMSKITFDELFGNIIDSSNYLPAALINYSRKCYIANKKNVTVLISLIELLTDFLIQEPGTPSIEIHQTIINKKMSLEKLFSILEDDSNKEQFYSGKLNIEFFKLLNRLQKNNTEVYETINKAEFISKKKLLHLLKREIENVIVFP